MPYLGPPLLHKCFLVFSFSLFLVFSTRPGILQNLLCELLLGRPLHYLPLLVSNLSFRLAAPKNTGGKEQVDVCFSSLVLPQEVPLQQVLKVKCCLLTYQLLKGDEVRGSSMNVILQFTQKGVWGSCLCICRDCRGRASHPPFPGPWEPTPSQAHSLHLSPSPAQAYPPDAGFWLLL